MIKRTLVITSPCKMNVRYGQVQILNRDTGETNSVSVEDLGYLILDHRQISITQTLLEELTSNNTVVVFCDSRHHPSSMLLNLDSNQIQSEIFRNQIEASLPLKKNLWKQTVSAKIRNQANLLKSRDLPWKDLMTHSRNVKSGDSDNREGLAARLYWSRLFGAGFRRDREGPAPNNMLNYGYIVLRAAVARALTGSGLLPTLGIHHKNRYNAFCLADDIMEPYRPYVDDTVIDIFNDNPDTEELDTYLKQRILLFLTMDTHFEQIVRPLSSGLSHTTASLARCFAGEARKIEYPVFEG